MYNQMHSEDSFLRNTNTHQHLPLDKIDEKHSTIFHQIILLPYKLHGLGSGGVPLNVWAFV